MHTAGPTLEILNVVSRIQTKSTKPTAVKGYDSLWRSCEIPVRFSE